MASFTIRLTSLLTRICLTDGCHTVTDRQSVNVQSPIRKLRHLALPSTTFTAVWRENPAWASNQIMRPRRPIITNCTRHMCLRITQLSPFKPRWALIGAESA